MSVLFLFCCATFVFLLLFYVSPPLPLSLRRPQVIGPNEKAMICVGEAWEVPTNKKLLGNVVELSLFHMKGPAIFAKLGSLLSSRSLPCLAVLRLHHNDFHTIKNVSNTSSTPPVYDVRVFSPNKSLSRSL